LKTYEKELFSISDNGKNKKQITEIIIDDMIILDNKGNGDHQSMDVDLEGQSEAPAMEETGSIDDIVIPDDINTDQTVPSNQVTNDDNKGEEMPF
jgi:hypothetical protein